MKNIFPLILLFLFISCETSTTESTTVSEPKEVKEPVPEAINYNLLTASSKVSWVGRKPTGKHKGNIAIESGNIKVIDGKIVGGKITIDMDKIEVQDLKSDDDSHMKLTEHLRSNDFFDVAQYPNAIFEITDVQPYDSTTKTSEEIYELKNQSKKVDETKEPTHEITGNLTLKNTTLSITFPAAVHIDSDQLIATADFVIDRTLWGIRYNEEADFTDKAQDQLIYDDVQVGFDIIANPEQEAL